MPSNESLLRLTQYAEGPTQYRVEVALEGDGLPRQAPTARFTFELSRQDRADLRWYLEDYLQYPLDPAPTVAARVEQRMAEIGDALFKALFQSDDDTRDLWAALRPRLKDTRVEIVGQVQQAGAIPWELLRDPKTGAHLALRARSFVHAQPNPAQRPQLPRASGPIRILLVICRPGRNDDVPFRSVASRLVKGLSDEARAVFQLDVLRPPTFERLSRVLHEASAAGQPYHVVHFDGHGAYGLPEKLIVGDSPYIFADARPGRHGYLAFENGALPDNTELVDGPALGRLLVEAGVPVLVLNACRSAHADDRPPTTDDRPPGGAEGESGRVGEGETDQSPISNLQSPISNPHEQVRAFGSLAQEVMDAGVAGVVAMRYNVYVVTAAQFVAELYAALAQGQTLGEAVTLGRKQLDAQPLRTIAYDPIVLRDWPVPVVYEAAPIALFPRPERSAKLAIDIGAADATPARGTLDPALPPQPDAGFFGRDETLLALDRAFDSQHVALLHAFAGSGKTTAAAEFARWYALTGGVEGPVLWTSFEQPKPLARVLDQLGQMFGPSLEQNGIHWLTLDDGQRRAMALQVLKQVPVLWVWDNVEPVAGFPSPADAALSAVEQRELAGFLRAARETKAKFLLTSRRDEQGWLTGLPFRIAVPPMPQQERVQLTRALAERHGRRIADIDDWRPLLWYTQGNPLTITVLVGQALRDGLRTRREIQSFVDRLRGGEATFDDEATEGRSKSLGASLSYGFAHAFAEDERKVLALLHLFQGFVQVGALQTMGHPDADYCLPEVRGLTREAGIALLDRAADVGLLTAHGRGFYSIHPALPWYFRGLFERYYPHLPSPSPAAAGEGEQSSPLLHTGDKRSTEGGLPGVRVTRAFVEVMGELGNYYAQEYRSGNRDVISVLSAEEANLLYARQLARANGWRHQVVKVMQGLDDLYDHTGRRTDWKRLVDEIVPDFVDATGGPLPGREEEWGLFTEYRVRLAQEARQWEEAERLQRARVDWDCRRAASALAVTAEILDDRQRNLIRSLGVSLHHLGEIQYELDQPVCVRTYEETIALDQRINDRPAEAIAALNLGNAYKDIPSLRDLAQAEGWYRRSLELRDERDRQGQAQCLVQLGTVARERFKEAQVANKPEEELFHYLNDAAQAFHQALDLLPPNAVNELAVAHNQLGNTYGNAGDLERALSHYREAIRYYEGAGDLYRAAQTRLNIAIYLDRAGRLNDALLYAQAALRNFATYGDRAAADIQDTQGLIAGIEQALRNRPGAGR